MQYCNLCHILHFAFYIFIQKIMTPEYQTETLSNGLRVIHRTVQSPVMYCGFMVDCGTRDEFDPSNPAMPLRGMAHFVEHILFKGTANHSSHYINRCMESVGGELNAFTTKEETTFYAIGQTKDFSRACQLLSDMVLNATAPEKELLREQEVVVEEIMSYSDTPSELIYDEFENELFVGHPLGHNILGDEDSVRSFHHDECIRFISEHYIPSRMVFFHQGQTPFSQVIKSLNRYFTPQQSSVSPIAGNRESLITNRSSLHVTRLDRGQCHIIIGTRSFPIGDERAAALALINNVLAGPGMSSRLVQELRERRGLVYAIEGSVTPYTDSGYWCTYFGCEHDDADRCLRLIRHQFDRFCNDGLSDSQLRAAKRQLCGAICIAAENIENRAIAMAKNLLRQGRVESIQETCQRVNSVTRQQVLDVAQQLFISEHA